MKIFIASDHGGFELKTKIEVALKAKFGIEVEDLGPYELNLDDDYPTFAKKVCQKVQSEADSLGILLCRSGIGMSIAANKFDGIYAALCTSEVQAERAREHNNANVLCLDSEFISGELNIGIAGKFVATNFPGEERHVRRINEIKELEKNN